MSHSSPRPQTPLSARVFVGHQCAHARTHRQTAAAAAAAARRLASGERKKNTSARAINDGAVGGGRSRVRRGGHPQTSHSKGGTAGGPPTAAFPRLFTSAAEVLALRSAQRRFRARELSFCAACLYPPPLSPLTHPPLLTTEASQLGATCMYSTCPSSH